MWFGVFMGTRCDRCVCGLQSTEQGLETPPKKQNRHNDGDLRPLFLTPSAPFHAMAPFRTTVMIGKLHLMTFFHIRPTFLRIEPKMLTHADTYFLFIYNDFPIQITMFNWQLTFCILGSEILFQCSYFQNFSDLF